MSGSHGPVPGQRADKPRWGFAVVRGDSMRPTLAPGDRLLLAYRRGPRPGDLVVARLPGDVVAVKRAAERRDTPVGVPGWWLLSDNPAAGTDSRQCGAVPEADVVAVVLKRIWPPRFGPAVPDSTGA